MQSRDSAPTKFSCGSRRGQARISPEIKLLTIVPCKQPYRQQPEFFETQIRRSRWYDRRDEQVESVLLS